MFEKIISAELLLSCLLALLSSIQAVRSKVALENSKLELSKLSSLQLYKYLSFLLLFILILLTLNQLFSAGRTIAFPGFLNPGTFLTRWYIPDADPWLRRLIEPSFWIIFAVIFLLGRLCGGIFAPLACQSLFALVAIESMLLHSTFRVSLQSKFSEDIIFYIHGIFIQAFLVLLVLALAKNNFYRPSRSQKEISLRLQVIGIFIFILTPLFCGFFLSLGQKFQIGAHYYSWFPENWKAGDVWSKLSPRIDPQLGRYLSDGTDTFPTHARWAEEYGIDYFIFDWWPQRTQIKRRVSNFVDQGLEGRTLKFSFMYESSDLKEIGDEKVEGEAGNVVYLTEKRIWRLTKHWEFLAREFMSHPNYLRVGDRAVLFVYTTRHLVGPVSQAILAARNHVEKTTGQKLFLIADEAYYNVLDFKPGAGTIVMPDLVPNWSRLTAFDAITAYNPYDDSRPILVDAGQDKLLLQKSITEWLNRSQRLYRRYSAHASAAGIPFIPTILPGYNDRGVRLAENHYVLPRMCADQESLFLRSLKKFAADRVSSSFTHFTITSWNEWNEGTQIEPSSESEASALDSSQSGRDYTQGYENCGYGFQYLEELEKFRREHEG